MTHEQPNPDPPNPEAEIWRAIADLKAEAALALMRLVAEFIKAVEAGDHQLLEELAPRARGMLREILTHQQELLADAEVAADPDWLDKFFDAEGDN